MISSILLSEDMIRFKTAKFFISFLFLVSFFCENLFFICGQKQNTLKLNMSEDKVRFTKVQYLIQFIFIYLLSLLGCIPNSETRKNSISRLWKKSKGHSSNCAATYNVELRQLSLFHGTISHVLRHWNMQRRTADVALRCRLRHICYCAPLIFLLTSYQPWNGVRRNKNRAKFSLNF
jgi:hypothetical protein